MLAHRNSGLENETSYVCLYLLEEEITAVYKGKIQAVAAPNVALNHMLFPQVKEVSYFL